MTDGPSFFDIVAIDARSARPLHAQIYGALRQAILDGVLRAGTRLPSTRVFASDLGIGRNTVVTAFEQLMAEGYIEARVGSGTRIAALPGSILPRNRRRSAFDAPLKGAKVRTQSRRGVRLAAAARYLPIYDRPTFAPGLPAIDEFPQHHWARILGRCARQSSPSYCDYSDMAGIPQLRKAIAEHLGAARGVRAEPEQIIIVTSAQAALDVTTRLTLDPGDVAWLEEPGYLGARGALIGASATLLPVSLDKEGLDVALGKARTPKPPKFIYVTPSHQCPTGITMSLPRRLDLLAYAQQSGAWVLEDDYDSEFRYRGNPISSLQGLDREGCVIYMGTFSKTLFPGLRVGYIVSPPTLVNAFEVAVCHTGQAVPKVLQAALAEFMLEGRFAEHIRRMRRLYAERQKIFISELSNRLSDRLTIRPSDTGIQLVTYLNGRVDDREVSAAARRINIVAPSISRFFLGSSARSGLFLGYAATKEERIAWGVGELARALNDPAVRNSRRRQVSTHNRPNGSSRGLVE